MMEAINWYLDTWWKIMARPIYFYVTLPSDSWSSKPLTFASVSAWALAAGLTITLFFTQYVPVGLTLVEGLSLKSLLIVSPVILLMALIFLALTLLVLGAISMGVFLGILYGVGVLIHFMLKMIGGSGSFFEMIKGTFYSSAVLLFALIPCFFAIITKYKLITFWQFQMSENIVYYVASIYIYGLWAIAGKKIHDVPRWKSFVAALLPLIVLIMVQIFLNKMIFPKIESLLT